MAERPTSSPSRIVIVGGGVLGLSTAWALAQRPEYSCACITIIDAAKELPNTSAASVDTSRILRADYALQPYTKLVSEAQRLWQDQSPAGWGGQGRYHEARLVLTAQPGTMGHVDGYLEESLENVTALARSGEYTFTERNLHRLPNREAVAREIPAQGVSGDYGYANDNCGWVNADACVRYVWQKLQSVGGSVEIQTNTGVRGLLYEPSGTRLDPLPRCSGVELEDGRQVEGDLVIVAAGAWTPALVDLQNRAVATGQVLAYLSLTEQEQTQLETCPIYFNVSRGMFMVPPHDRELKFGRHGFGYQNPTRVSLPSPKGGSIEAIVSVPRTDLPIPVEGERACREFMLELFPQWKDRLFTKTRVCWYCDTPTGDFLIDYYPHARGLFLATGDSGHAFKVFPVIGEKVADAIASKLDPSLQELWRWRDEAPAVFHGTDDGTRGGRQDMKLMDEYEKCEPSKPKANLLK